MTAKPSSSQHGIKDNHTRGKVADFLGAKLVDGSRLSVVSAYFTIYAYEALREELEGTPALLEGVAPDRPAKPKPRSRAKRP